MTCLNRVFWMMGILCVTVLVSIPAVAQSSSNVNYTLHYPITQTIQDVCTNVTVDLSGEYFFEYHMETKPNGDSYEHWTSHYNVTGMENGIKYVGNDQQSYSVRLDPDGSFPPVPTSDFRTSDKFKLIAQGKAPDMTVMSKLHIRVDANNNVKVDQEGSPVTKCK